MPPPTWLTSILAPCVLGAALLAGPLSKAREPPLAGWDLPAQAQVIDQRAFNALERVESQEAFDGSSLFYPPGTDASSLKARPYHVYHDDFYAVIGPEPTLTLIAATETDPLFHEAVVWYPPTDEVFFVQNAGARAAGTGLAKSAIIQKIDLAQADAAKHKANATGEVDVRVVPSQPQVINPNGGTNWRGQIVFAGEGQGADVPSALYAMNPVAPYNTTVLVNNFFGRQFSSLNDVAVHPSNGWIYFTDVDYGHLQDFRAKVNIRRQVYRWHPDTGVIQAVADYTLRPNGLTFSPDGKWLYVTDTGAAQGFTGVDWSAPASIYRLPVNDDGTLGPNELFTYVHVGVPDGVHCDTKGNVYSGVGDGLHVWNPAGTLIGKIYTGAVAANFQFAGKGRIVICCETELYYGTLAAEGAHITDL
ncbi:hypothetical protein Q8F55_001202 [Vanrija albida]|uniref:SMP-30/Gluconolactonase/LRE-like region domain-containing protein n=1 Tax=Vanrija albida TaxID=181172 RepID=A0ABR3QFK8_9TREE